MQEITRQLLLGSNVEITVTASVRGSRVFDELGRTSQVMALHGLSERAWTRPSLDF